MKKYPLYDVPNYVNMRELVEDIDVKYSDKIAYSYRLRPNDEAVTQITYHQLVEDVRALATSAVLQKITNAHVALIGKLSYEWVCTYLAILSVGGVVVPLDADWSTEDLAEAVKKAECATMFCTQELFSSKGEEILTKTELQKSILLDTVEGENAFQMLIAYGREARNQGDTSYEEARISPDQMALLVFTSGTTGKGKGVMLSQTAILSDITSGLKYIQITEKTIGVLPPHHTFGSTINILGHLITGTEMYISSGIRYLLRELKEQKPGHIVLVPLFLETFWRKIMDSVKESGKEKIFTQMMKLSNRLFKTGIDMRRKIFSEILSVFGGNLKMILCGGAPLNQSLVDSFQAIGITVINGYGITECAPLISANHSQYRRKNSVGLGITIDLLKIKNPDINGEGEICVKGSNVMLGYYKDPQATEAAFDKDGYFLTGDLGKLDSEGWLYITGRVKNLIILSNGKNVYPEEIEAEFSTVPGVLDVVVYEGISKQNKQNDAIVAEIYPDSTYLEKNGIADAYEYFKKYVSDYNRTAVPYKKIGVLKIRKTEFPKNTLRKIVRFKIDKSID